MKIVWFLLGFVFSFACGLQFVHADCAYDPTDQEQWSGIYEYLGTVTKADYQEELHSIGGGSWTITSHNKYLFAADGTGAYINVCTVREFPAYTGQPNYYCYFIDGTDNGDVCMPVPDSDDDGLPDKIDAYPDDIKRYQFQVLERYYDALGNQIGVLIETSYDDKILLGLDAEGIDSCLSDGSCNGVPDSSGSWYDSDNLAYDQDLIPLDLDAGPYIIPSTDIPKITSDQPATDTDDHMTPSEASTGTETLAEQKIIDNTKATSDNVARLGDYLKSINSNIQGINSSTTITKTETSSIKNTLNQSLEDDSTTSGDYEQEDVSSAVTAIDNATSATDTTQVVSDLTTELQTDTGLEDLPDQTGTEGEGLTGSWWDYSVKIGEFMAENPITQALTGIEVEATGNCSFTYNWTPEDGSVHPILFSICGFEDTLNIFGQVLLMITSFNAIFMLFRRN